MRETAIKPFEIHTQCVKGFHCCHLNMVMLRQCPHTGKNEIIDCLMGEKNSENSGWDITYVWFQSHFCKVFKGIIWPYVLQWETTLYLGPFFLKLILELFFFSSGHFYHSLICRLTILVRSFFTNSDLEY